MLATEPDPQARRTAEPIIVWASADGTRCVLATAGGVLELRVEHNGVVLRRAHYLDIRPACEAARQWRIDWDIESRLHRQTSGRLLCPECGDEALRERDASTARSGFGAHRAGMPGSSTTPQLKRASGERCCGVASVTAFGATPLLLLRPVVLERTSAYGRSAHSG